MKTKLLIFGITGDLSTRKLLPALKHIYATGNYDDLSIIGVSRREVNVAELLQASVGDDNMASKVSIFTMDLANTSDYHRLKDYVALGDDEQLLVYLSVPPQAASGIVELMGKAGITTPNVKILFEKPFGTDLESAKETIAHTAQYYDEDQLYRIDHYLAKEMAQNIIAIRGGNALVSNIWNNNFIQAIEITASEQIGIEGRTQFYEQTGALRDFVQGHLMQLLALTLMDIPHDFDWKQLPELRLKALEQLQLADPAKVIRAQYDTYQQEVGNPGSLTETFVSLQLASNQPRWLDVPIRLTTGKALDSKTTEIRIHLKKMHEAQSNCIIFRIQPDEGIDIELFTKKPGYDRDFETRHLTFNLPEGERLPDAYEQVIVDAIRSHKSLFTSSSEVLRAWEVLEPVQIAWAMDGEVPFIYPAGSAVESVIATSRQEVIL
jgi:glucose-6-phosphate 1-dehydrogenase